MNKQLNKSKILLVIQLLQKKIMRYKLYSIVLWQLSDKQKGIQHGHAKDFFEKKYSHTPEYQQWLHNDVTVIVLQTYSTDLLLSAANELKEMEIPVSIFNEPDLGGIPTGISFLVDEVSWDKEKYPDGDWEILALDPPVKGAKLKELEAATQYAANIALYGKRAAFLRQFTSKFSLA